MVNALVSLLLPNLAAGAQPGATGGGLLAANPFDGMSAALNFSSFLDLQGKPVNPAQLPELLGTIKEEGGFESLLNVPDMELPDFEKIESLDQAIMVAAVIFPALPTVPEPVLTTGGTEAVEMVDVLADVGSMSPEEFVADIIEQMKQTIPGLTFGVLKPAVQPAAPETASLDMKLEQIQSVAKAPLLELQPAAIAAAATVRTGSKITETQEEVPDLTAAVPAPATASDAPEEKAEKATAVLTTTVTPLLAGTLGAGDTGAAQPVTAEQVIAQKIGSALVADASVTEEEAAAVVAALGTADEKKLLLKTSAAPVDEDEELIKKKDDKKEDKGAKFEVSGQTVQQQTEEPVKQQRLQADTSIKSVTAEDGSSNQQSSTGDRQQNTNSANSIQQQVQNLLQADNNKDTAETSFMKMVREAQAHHSPVADQISINIKHAIHNQSDNIRIQLSPHDLGAVDIMLTMKGDEITHIRVLAEKAETLDMLQRDSRFLERSLQESGLKADSGSLQFGLKGEQGGNAQGSGQDANGNRKYQPHYGMTGAAEEETKPLAWQEIGGTDVLIASTGINIRV